ncbi:vesicle-associated membrane protein 2 isoform X2 [Euwallacea fornicatus]|uniref:vesicle-associated membrane protein 2 isoform X2 n=2 Tax=Euwallacea TaxID=124011 RepID=UPI00339007E3
MLPIGRCCARAKRQHDVTRVNIGKPSLGRCFPETEVPDFREFFLYYKRATNNPLQDCTMSAGDTLGTGGPGAGGDSDGIVGGPRTPQQIAAQKRLQQTQAQVDEVVDIMKTNVEKVLERDQKLSELDDRADALQQGASQFEQQAGKLKRKFWLQNLKMMIIMGVIGLVILIIIIMNFM